MKFNCSNCRTTTIKNDQQYVKHLFSGCRQTDQSYAFASRHNVLKYAIADVLRHNGVAVAVEPTIFSHSYDNSNNNRNNSNAKLQRPDLAMTLPSSVATDFVITGTPSAAAGDNAACAAKEKNKTHTNACKAHGFMFFPFAAEIHGHLHADVFKMIAYLARQVSFELREDFIFQMFHTTSLVLARSRIMMLINDNIARRNVELYLNTNKQTTEREEEKGDELETNEREENQEDQQETQNQNQELDA